MNINEKLDMLIGKKCWAVSCGPPTASDLFLNFGDKLLRKKPIPNKNLEYDLDKYDGEYVLGVFSAWRLQKAGIPIIGSCEPNYKNGPIYN